LNPGIIVSYCFIAVQDSEIPFGFLIQVTQWVLSIGTRGQASGPMKNPLEKF